MTGLAASGLLSMTGAEAAEPEKTVIELKKWHLHNSPEEQGKRLADYLQQGLAPALGRAGAPLKGAFANVIGEGGPYYITLVQYESLASMGDVLKKLAADDALGQAAQKLAAGEGRPFVGVESSLLRSFDVMPRITSNPKKDGQGSRIFEMRTYQAPSFTALTRKVGMFNKSEAKIFERLGMQPVFFGETFVGPKQPNLTYMLSYENLAARDTLWQSFVQDPEWKKLSAIPELKDAQIVSNISNVILRPLPFSEIR